MEHISYENHYCAFIDILGFSSLIKESATQDEMNIIWTKDSP